MPVPLRPTPSTPALTGTGEPSQRPLPATRRPPVDARVVQIVNRAAGQVRLAAAALDLCAHVPSWPPARIRSIADLNHAEAAAQHVRMHLTRRTCSCLGGLRAHILNELLRRWQELARAGRLTTRVAAQPSRVSQQIGQRFAELAEALTADTAWLAGRAGPHAVQRRAG